MSSGVARRLARLAGAMLKHACPARRSTWAEAMRYEIGQVKGDGDALMFALGCLWAGCRQTSIEQFSVMKGLTMSFREFGILGQPRNAGIACALGATCLGLAYLMAAGAPMQYLVVNAAAFILGIIAVRGIAGSFPSGRFTSVALVLLGLSLLLTALLGASADGASRWIWVGPLSVQVSLVVLPFMIVAFARHADAVGAAGIAITAVALALQPDRAMAGVLAFSMAALAISRPGPAPTAALLVAVAGFAATLVQPDALPAVPYVDQVLFKAFDIHVAVGAAVLFGALLLLLPSVIGWQRNPAQRTSYLVFGVIWLGCIFAAVLGNYPTPVVGYGGSAILGYLLSLAGLPADVRAAKRVVTDVGDEEPQQASGLSKRALPA